MEPLQKVLSLLTSAEDSPASWLTKLGWGRHSFFRLPALSEQYGWPLPPEADMVFANAPILLTASR